MFNDPKVLPQFVRRVHLLISTPLKSEIFPESLVGRALKRLQFDKRIHANILSATPSSERESQLTKRWKEIVGSVYKNQTDGFVWIRDDVVCEDYFLIERLSEAWPHQDMVELYDDNGRLVLWAMCARGVRKWLKAYAEKSNQTISNNQVPDLPVLGGSFPENYVKHSKEFSVLCGSWPIFLSRVADVNLSGEKEQIFDAARIPIKVQLAKSQPPLLVVCATRETAETFKTNTATGRSLERMKQYGVEIQAQVVCENKGSLSDIYNRAIDPKFIDHMIIFMHDDVWVDDLLLAQHLHEALLRYDVIGVAGSRNRLSNQPSWMYPSSMTTRDQSNNLLGCVAHDLPDHAHSKDRNWVSVYGSKRGSARLLDGVFLASTGRSLLQSGARFDSRFSFHFYDLDFCCTAENAGLRLGVWPLAISHCSAGSFRSVSWYAAYGTFTSKWQEL